MWCSGINVDFVACDMIWYLLVFCFFLFFFFCERVICFLIVTFLVVVKIDFAANSGANLLKAYRDTTVVSNENGIFF